MSIIGAILAFFFLEGALRVGVIAFLLATDVVEIYIWLRWRKKKSITGMDALVGKTGIAVTECAPDGQVKVNGQLWRASCGDPLAPGDPIVVTHVEGMRLQVARR